MAKASDSPWRCVAGPTTALLASLQRLGWNMPSSAEAIDDLGCSWSFVDDPPAAILGAGKRSVRRWRHHRIAKDIPGLVPDTVDAGQLAQSGRTVLIDFADVCASVCRQRGPSKLIPFWHATYRGDAVSALSGGQWTQARRASVPRWNIDDNRCQLCLQAVGTVPHRFDCPATRPPGGWPAPPEEAALCRQRIGARRCDLLDYRGHLVLKLPMPDQHEAQFKWFHCVDILPADAVWYIDGSMMFSEVYKLRSVGFGVVVHSRSEGLVGYGGGVPPWWCRTAAAAEAWALYVALSLSVAVPVVKTDCLALLHNAQSGAVAATSPTKMLARIWNLISGILDGDFSGLADHRRLVWLPAHQGFGAIHSRVLSDGKLYSVIDWRANRLVDAIAKAFANDHAVPCLVSALTLSARCAVRHSVALLGCVTHAANNHIVQETSDDGSTIRKRKRDVTEHVTKRARKERCPLLPSDGPVQTQPACKMPCPDHLAGPFVLPGDVRPARSHTVAMRQHSMRAAELDRQRLRERVSAIGSACSANASPAGSAAARMMALAEGVRAKASRL